MNNFLTNFNVNEAFINTITCLSAPKLSNNTCPLLQVQHFPRKFTFLTLNNITFENEIVDAKCLSHLG